MTNWKIFVSVREALLEDLNGGVKVLQRSILGHALAIVYIQDLGRQNIILW